MQPNFSVVLETYASTELSNLYYPSSSQTHVTANNMLLELGLDSVNGLLLEFVYPHLTIAMIEETLSEKLNSCFNRAGASPV